jgi:predicted dehydrogenase
MLRSRAEFDIPHVESDWRAIMSRYDVDLVSIVTPVVQHCEMVLAALHRGKAVLCEKPMAMNADEAKRMMESAREAGALALIDHELRFLPGRIKMRELIHQGAIGKVRHAALTSDRIRAPIRIARGIGGLTKSRVAARSARLARMWSTAFAGFSERRFPRWTANLATHISERKDHEGRSRPVTTDDETNMLLRFADGEFTEGATGMASMSLVEAGKPEHRLEIFGSSGALMIEENGDLWQSQVGDGQWNRVEVGAESWRRACATAVGPAASRFFPGRLSMPCAPERPQWKARLRLKMAIARNWCWMRRARRLREGAGRGYKRLKNEK